MESFTCYFVPFFLQTSCKVCNIGHCHIFVSKCSAHSPGMCVFHLIEWMIFYISGPEHVVKCLRKEKKDLASSFVCLVKEYPSYDGSPWIRRPRLTI